MFRGAFSIRLFFRPLLLYLQHNYRESDDEKKSLNSNPNGAHTTIV